MHVWNLEMFSSGEIILTNSPDNPHITAYDVSSGAILAHFTGTLSPRTKGLALVGNTSIAAAHISYSSSPAASVHLYNWWSSAPLRHLPLPEPVAPLAATPDGLHLFCGGVSGYIHALNLPSGCLLCSFPAHSKPVSSCIVNDDVSLLISGGDDGTLSIFPLLQILDANANHPITALYCFQAHASSVTAIASGFGGSNIISCSLDCTCKFWSLAHDATPIRSVSFPCMLWCLALDSTESNFYVGGSNGRIYVGATKANSRRSNPQMLVSLSPQHNGAVTAVAMVNEGQNLVSASEDGSVCIWDVDTGMVVRVIGNGRETISDIVVARGIRNGGCSGGMRFGAANVIELRGAVLESCGGVMDRPVRELAELEESLKVVVRDRRRALDTLEGTIDTYQRLLGLILKELKVATGGGDDDNNNKDKKKRDNDDDMVLRSMPILNAVQELGRVLTIFQCITSVAKDQDVDAF